MALSPGETHHGEKHTQVEHLNGNHPQWSNKKPNHKRYNAWEQTLDVICQVGPNDTREILWLTLSSSG